jgi:hypothetical protein
MANRTAVHTANQQGSLRLTFQKLPGFLEQLRPALQKLGAATDANTPVLNNLNAASGQFDRLLSDLPSFSTSAQPAIKSLGTASVTGKQAVQAASSTIAHLNAFAKPTPELAKNLAIVLHDLDNRSRAVEKDPRSPGGQGYTGLEAVLQYVFNQTLAINTFGPFGHQLAVDAFVDPRCTPYATPATIAANLKQFGASYRKCYSWLGPNQAGVNVRDPSNPSACVPDPGGAPPGQRGPATTACKLAAADTTTRRASAAKANKRSTARATAGSPTSSTGPPSGSNSGSSHSPLGLQKTLGQILGALGGAGSPSTPSATTAGSGTGSSGGNQAQQLLNYLLAP